MPHHNVESDHFSRDPSNDREQVRGLVPPLGQDGSATVTVVESGYFQNRVAIAGSGPFDRQRCPGGKERLAQHRPLQQEQQVGRVPPPISRSSSQQLISYTLPYCALQSTRSIGIE